MAEEDISMDVDTPTSTTTHKDEEDNEESVIPVNMNPSASADAASKDPDMALAQSIHRLFMCTGPLVEAADRTAAGIPEDLSATVLRQVLVDVENPSLYRRLAPLLPGWEGVKSEEELAQTETAHAATVALLERKVDEARASAGDSEVLTARQEVARFAARSLDQDAALRAYDALLALPKLSPGKTIDALMEQSRVASFHGDTQKNAALVDKAVRLASDGGDWDRRNRLKVYHALDRLLARDTKTAASLLLDCLATFSCNELCGYTDFVVYTVLTNLLHLPRTQLKEQIIDGPEILSVANEIPVVIKLATALYECDYRAYLHAMVDVQPVLLADRFLQPHAGYMMRELHVLGYKQFLDSYKSVTLESMASSFGVSQGFLDLQLSRFIAAGRLTAKIDKYGGVVETNRPDLKNAQYRDMIQQGDLLLNRIQKLTRVVDL